MKNLDELQKNCLARGEDGGAYRFQSPFRKLELDVIASNGDGWDHVSVSTCRGCPRWEEMCYIKNKFFNESECVIQYHPAKENYVNNHPYCLHMWKPQNIEIPVPPKYMV